MKSFLGACLMTLGTLAGPTSAFSSEFDCVIQPRQLLEIRSPIEGLIERISVDRGHFVRRGQELAYIDSSVERLAAESAKHRSEMLGATRAAESKILTSSRKLIRMQELLKQDFISVQSKDDAQNEKLLAEAELREAQDNRRLAEIEYRRQMTIIALKTIKSPINGVVTERVLGAGELAEAGVGRKPILKLAEIDTLYVEALLPAEAYRQVKVGMPGSVHSASLEGGPERATIAVIDRVLDPGSGTFGVRLELPNPRRTLLAGVRCKLQLDGVTLNPPKRTGEPPRGAGTRTPSAPPLPSTR